MEIKISELSHSPQAMCFGIRREMRTCCVAVPGTRVWIRSDMGQAGRKILGASLIEEIGGRL